MPRQRGTGVALTLTTTNEGAAAIVPGITLQAVNPVDILGSVDVTTGTGVTGVTINLRRGNGITGAIVQAFGPFAIAASTRGVFDIACFDQQNVDVAGQQYSLCVVQVGATGNGTVNFAYVRADW